MPIPPRRNVPTRGTPARPSSPVRPAARPAGRPVPIPARSPVAPRPLAQQPVEEPIEEEILEDEGIEEQYEEEPVEEEVVHQPVRPGARIPGRASASGARAVARNSPIRGRAPASGGSGGVVGFFAEILGGIFHGVLARLIILGGIVLLLVIFGFAIKLSGWRSGDDRGTEVIARKLIRELPDYSKKSDYYNKLIDVAHTPAYEAATTAGTKISDKERVKIYLSVLFSEMSKKARADKESAMAEKLSTMSANAADF